MSLNLELFCLHDPRYPAAAFKRVLSKDAGSESYTCSLKKLLQGDPKNLGQLTFFTQGDWGEDPEIMSIDIILKRNDKPLHICTLNSSLRCFQWTTPEPATLLKMQKVVLEAKMKNVTSKAVTSLTENKENDESNILSSPVVSKMTESEEMKKLNETTPQAEASSQMQSPLPAKVSKKRRRDEETTPKPKSRRQKVSMKALAPEKTPPAKQKLGEIKASNDVEIPDEMNIRTISNEGKITRCVDLSARTPKPSNRWGHTMCLVNSKQAFLIGGQGEKLSKDSIWILDPEMRTWKCPDVVTEGVKPEYRIGHSATYDPTMRCIYIYGGSKTSKWFHDVHMFDLDENKWTLVKANGKAPTRAYHSATLYRHEIWIFGGVFPRPDPQPDGCDNEIHIFSPVMESWYKPIVTGEKPQPRSGHSATLMNDVLVVFGGWDFPYCYNDLFILDLTTVDWSSPKVYGQPPKPRSWHASCALTHDRIFIHGGYDGDNALHDAFIFDLGSKTWHELALENAPSARAGHSCLRLPSDYENQDEDEIIVFGGGDNDGSYFSDMLSFYIPFKPKMIEHPIDIEPQKDSACFTE